MGCRCKWVQYRFLHPYGRYIILPHYDNHDKHMICQNLDDKKYRNIMNNRVEYNISNHSYRMLHWCRWWWKEQTRWNLRRIKSYYHRAYCFDLLQSSLPPLIGHRERSILQRAIACTAIYFCRTNICKEPWKAYLLPPWISPVIRQASSSPILPLNK